METRDPEADIYSAIGIAFWNWTAAILASNLLRLGFGWGIAVFVYVGFVSISQFLLVAMLFAGFAIYRLTNRLLGIAGPRNGPARDPDVALTAAMSPEERRHAAERFRRTGLRPPTAGDSR